MNLNIREFKQAIVNFINQNKLPIEVKRMVLSEILKAVEMESDRIVIQEIEKRDKKEQSKIQELRSEE